MLLALQPVLDRMKGSPNQAEVAPMSDSFFADAHKAVFRFGVTKEHGRNPQSHTGE